MKLSVFSVFLTGVALWSQNAAPPAPAAPAPIPPEAVVATVDGRKITAGDLQKLVMAVPELQRTFTPDRKEFLRQYILLERLVALAEKNKLDQRSPYRDRVEYSRSVVLMQAVVDDQFDKIDVTAEETNKHYEANKGNYSQAKLKVIYVPFTVNPVANPDPNAPKPMTEAEARQQAEKAVEEARKGADFVELVKKYSRDAASAAKDGDFGVLKKADNIPEVIKTAIFSLKPGEVTAPLRQANGYYVFRLVEMTQPPLEQIKDQVIQQVRQGKMQQWFEQMRSGINIKIENEAYFAKPQPMK
jgi:hypothetical protein